MTKFQSIRALWVASVAVSVASASLIGEAAAGCRAGAPPRIVHRAYTYRDIVEPGLYPVTREPSRYGWVSKPVKVPGPVIWHDEPPVYRTVHVKVRKPGCWAVEKRVIDGRPAVCPVYVPSTYTTVERQVLVRPARRWAEPTTSIAYVHRRILLRPYKNIVQYQPPEVHWRKERLDIRPEEYCCAPQPNC